MNIDLTNPIFHDEAKATVHMEADRWPDGVNCPFCGSVNVHRMGGKTQAGMFLCNDCRDKFTVRTGTIFERSHIPLYKWLLATHIIAASKKERERTAITADARPWLLPFSVVHVPSYSRSYEARKSRGARRQKSRCGIR